MHAFRRVRRQLNLIATHQWTGILLAERDVVKLRVRLRALTTTYCVSGPCRCEPEAQGYRQ